MVKPTYAVSLSRGTCCSRPRTNVQLQRLTKTRCLEADLHAVRTAQGKDGEQVNATCIYCRPQHAEEYNNSPRISAAGRVDTGMSPLFKLEQQKNTSTQQKVWRQQ